MNKHLAKDDKLVVLSEVHPIHNRKGGLHSVKAQMQKWYGVELLSRDYVDQILEAKSWCDEHDRVLVLRDWTYIDFAKSHLNDYAPPLGSTNLSLLRPRAEVRPLAFVRDGIDVLLSFGGNIEEFALAYSAYARFIVSNNVGVHKYEDFVCDTNAALKRLYTTLGQPAFHAHDIDLVENDKVTGDTSLSRGNTNKTVVQIKRRYAGYSKRRRIDGNTRLSEANRLFGYSGKYGSREIEPFKDWIQFELQTLPRNLRSWKSNAMRAAKFRVKGLLR